MAYTCSWLIAIISIVPYCVAHTCIIELKICTFLTGAARYVPGSQTAPGFPPVSMTFQSGQGADPLTGTITCLILHVHVCSASTILVIVFDAL